MRRTRLSRFRKKNRPLMIILKTVIIGYLLMFSVSFLTAETVAYFDGHKQVSEILITAGTWDDEELEVAVIEEENNSSLAFTGEENQRIETCPALIEVEITNEGEGMLDDGVYEVYYVEAGDPEEDGEKVELEEDEGVIEALDNGEKVNLTHETGTSGVYIFVAFENEDAADEERLWSEEITVNCEPNEPEQSSENETQENEESANTVETSTDKKNSEEPTTEEATTDEEVVEQDAQENESEEKDSNDTADDDSTYPEDVENEEAEENEVD